MVGVEAVRAGGDVDLLARAAAGDRDSVREVLDVAGPIVYGFVFARVGGDASVAEDIVQETFVEAVRSASTFRGDAALTTWLCAIARHRIARHYARERKQEVARSALTLIDDEGQAAAIDERDALVRALGALSALHRQVLVLKYLDGKSVSDIADELGRTRVQVQSLLQRARDGLRRQLEGSA